MTKHTPAPWIPNRNLTVWASVDNSLIAQVAGPRDNDPDPESNANAHLIAAAPELLEAVKACADILERITPLPITKGGLTEEQDAKTALRLAYIAISKATPIPAV